MVKESKVISVVSELDNLSVKEVISNQRALVERALI